MVVFFTCAANVSFQLVSPAVSRFRWMLQAKGLRSTSKKRLRALKRNDFGAKQVW
jgi:hypothetical protein